MTILASLNRVYGRLKDGTGMPPFGFATQNIHCCITIDKNGSQVGLPAFWNRGTDGKPSARPMDVPYFGGRSGSNAPPYFLWDNTAYVLGVTAKEGFDATRRFKEFKQLHLDAFAGVNDEGLVAVGRFLEKWNPENFAASGFTDEIRDRNVVFRLDSEGNFIQERTAAVDLWNQIYKPDTIGRGICLITGNEAEIVRLHPPIISFENPARIVSFDKDNDAFSSYGHVQAENAPTGVEAAFAYTAVLNRFLSRGSKHRIQIGDASTVFWADASDVETAELAHAIFGACFEVNEATQSEKVGAMLTRIRNGEPMQDIAPELGDGVRFYVLGLAPNAARLSIRYWFEDEFRVLAEHFRRYFLDLRFEPQPVRKRALTISACILRTAPARIDKGGNVKFDADRISPLVSGELFRAIISGGRFPLSLLSLLVQRIRSDHFLDHIRISLIKANIVRNMRLDGRLTDKEDYLMRSDPYDPNPARRFGRFFALVERAQLASLGDEVNSTLKDKFLGSAAAFSPSAQRPFRCQMDQGSGSCPPDWRSIGSRHRQAGCFFQRSLARPALR
jgi:CRISPR-associated protein Csd1